MMIVRISGWFFCDSPDGRWRRQLLFSGVGAGGDPDGPGADVVP